MAKNKNTPYAITHIGTKRYTTRKTGGIAKRRGGNYESLASFKNLPQYNELEKSRYLLSGYGVVFQFIPVIGLLVNIGFKSWILLYLLYYLFINKRYKEITILLPGLVSLLVCFASPANTYFRYALPYVASAPLLIYLIINNINTKIKKG